MRKGLRIFGRCVLVLLGIFFVLCTAGEIRQRILVHRAAALLSDIHSLRLRQSDWKDAQHLMIRWGRWGHYDGACTSDDCMYVVSLNDLTVQNSGNAYEWPSRMTYFLAGFRLLPRQFGGGLRIMQAMFLVQDGLVVRSGVWIDMTPSPFAKGAPPSCCGAELILSVRSKASLGVSDGVWDEQRRSRHPDYTVWRPGGCTFCLMERVTYADSVSAAEATRLSDFQLSCATRWSSCLTLEELDPAAHAWHLYASPWGDPPAKMVARPTAGGCTLPLYSLGRDADLIMQVEVLDDAIGFGKDGDDNARELSHVRLLAPIKGNSLWAADSTQAIVSSGSQFSDPSGDSVLDARMPTHMVKGGHYLLMLSKNGTGFRERDDLDACGIVKANAANFSEVLRGVAMDDRLRGYEPTISLEGFVRHSSQLWDH